MTRRFHMVIALLAVAAVGCGGDDGGEPGAGECGFEDNFLPYSFGYGWIYNITDLRTGVRTTKTQSLSTAAVASADFPGIDFIEQTTIKATGTTVSLLTVEGDTILRHRQEDFDLAGVSERVTVYTPPKLRLDETAARLEMGATFEETYTATVTDSNGEVATSITDQWEVVSTDAACMAPLGAFNCVQVRRTRTDGGIAIKDFMFARGIGKVREEGEKQIEELADCSGGDL